MDLLKVKDKALSFMKPANREVLKWFRGQYKIELKSDSSPVTIADRNAEEILRKNRGRAEKKPLLILGGAARKRMKAVLGLY